MRGRVIGGVLLWSSVCLGCQSQPKVAMVPEGAVVQNACEVPPPIYIEVPVPVPMPCQLKPDPVFATARARRNGKARVQRVAQRPDTARGINSVQEYPYMPGALYQVYVGVDTATTVLLQPGEYFSQAVIGDKAHWTTSEIAAGSAHGERGGVVVNCNTAGAKSNLTIAGSKRVYLLELQCTATTYHAQVTWTYPEERGVGVLKGTHSETAPAPARHTMAVADVPSSVQYRVTSNRQVPWLPTQVYDTGAWGRQTYIVFPPSLHTTDAPVVYVRTAEGTQAVVNYRVKQGYWLGDRVYNAEELAGKIGGLGDPVTYYVLDHIADQLELRVGEKKPTIVTITRQGQGA